MSPTLKLPQQFVLFFGSENYAWVSEDTIWGFAQHRDKFTLTNRVPKGFREAIESVDDYVKSLPEPDIKTSDLPTIDDEIAAIFPEKTTPPHHKDYTREPLSGKKVRLQKDEKSSDERTKIKERKDSMGNNKSGDKVHKEKKEKPKETAVVEKEKRERRVSRKSSTEKNEKSEKKLKRPGSPSGQKPLSSKKSKLVVKIGASPSRNTTSPVPKKMDSEKTGEQKSTKSPPSPTAARDNKTPTWLMKSSTETPTVDDAKYDFSDDDFDQSTQSQIDSAINTIGQIDKSATLKETASPKLGPPGSPSQLHNTSNSTNSSLSESPLAAKSLDQAPTKNIIPTPMKIGYLGLGIMGQGMVMNLLKSGHEVTVWNRTSHKCRDFVKLGALRGNSPADVVQSCDITFSCVADPQALKDLVFSNSGVIHAIRPGKGYVDMSTVDVDTCTDIYEAVTAKGGRFLEAPVVGSRQPAHEGRLVILAAGDKSLFDDCYSCFEAMGKKSYFLGDVGNGARMKLLANMISGVMVAGLAEGMALAERVGVKQEDLLDIMSLGDMDSQLLKTKGQAILIDDFDPNCPLQHQQKDLRLAISLADSVDQPLPVTASANELYKKAKAIGYGENDVSAVYKVTYL